MKWEIDLPDEYDGQKITAVDVVADPGGLSLVVRVWDEVTQRYIWGHATDLNDDAFFENSWTDQDHGYEQD